MPGQKGNRGGQKGRSGRKSRAEELGLTSLLDGCWTQAQREEVVNALYLAAIGGNVPAAALLMAYAYGKPTETIKATITHQDFEVDIGGDAHQGEQSGEPEFVN